MVANGSGCPCSRPRCILMLLCAALRTFGPEEAAGMPPRPPSPLCSSCAARRLPLLSDACAIRRLVFFAKTKSTGEELTFGLADTFEKRFFTVQERRGSSNRTISAPPYWPHSEGELAPRKTPTHLLPQSGIFAMDRRRTSCSCRIAASDHTVPPIIATTFGASHCSPRPGYAKLERCCTQSLRPS